MALRSEPVREDRPVLDDRDRAIIRELQEDGRRSYVTIARAINLSEAAVRQRVQRLRDCGLVQIVAVTDPLSLDLGRQAMVGIRVDGDMRTVATALAEIPEINYVVACAGSFDIMIELVVTDDEALLALLNDSVRVIPGVRETETFLYLKLVKQTYDWGTAALRNRAAQAVAE